MKTLICDLDNTLLDTLTKLESLVGGFEQEKQAVYTLKNELLEPFIDGEVYKGVEYNTSVVEQILELRNKGYYIQFITQTMSTIARDLKYEITDRFENEYNLRVQTLATFDDTIEQSIEIFTHENYTEVVVIDDAPERLDKYLEIKEKRDLEIIMVEYPYNKHYKDKVDKVIQPNYKRREK